jgi:hypothetical protein
MIGLGKMLYKVFAPRIQARFQRSFRYFQSRIPKLEIVEGKYIV